MGGFNPFEPDNFSSGFGWDGKTVTITGSQFITDYFGTDENPWIDPKTEERGFSNVWAFTGIHEDSDRERTEKWSIGKTNIPTADGEGFERRDGKPASFHPSSQAARLSAALKDAGFDTSKLVVDGVIKASALVGARFVFKGYTKKDKDGKPKEDKNGFVQYEYFPVEFVGFQEGLNKTETAEASQELENRAYDLVTQLLEAAEGKTFTRVQLIQAVSKALAGDKDLSTIMSLVTGDKFNSAAPWKVEGTTISLA